jgi:tRNA nucleotidyltransferase (CCA-adding enzyme)
MEIRVIGSINIHMLHEEEKIFGINKEEFERIFTPNIKRVIEAVRKYGFDVRVVGGAVRDFLIGKRPRDVDFATDADPSELIYIFQLEGIDFDAKGIGHGTIKAKFGDDKIDVTSITYKLDRIGGKMVSRRGMDWEKDANSRDLTINSMSLDLNGKVHDYVDGLDDLSRQVVRFNDGIADDLRKDPHLIMRWFKALGLFDNPSWPEKDWISVMDNMETLSSIRNDEKTEKELASILRGKNARKILDIMCANGADRYLDLSCYR